LIRRFANDHTGSPIPSLVRTGIGKADSVGLLSGQERGHHNANKAACSWQEYMVKVAEAWLVSCIVNVNLMFLLSVLSPSIDLCHPNALIYC